MLNMLNMLNSQNNSIIEKKQSDNQFLSYNPKVWSAMLGETPSNIDVF